LFIITVLASVFRNKNVFLSILDIKELDMKKIYFVLLILLFFKGFSQNDEVVVILLDEFSSLSVEDATITISRTSQGLLSNKDGLFKINIKKPSVIEITHTSYKKMTIKSSSLKEKENILYLISNTNDLEEIIVTKENPQDILREVIYNSLSKITIPANLKVYTREFFKKDNVYSYYNDGLLNFQITGDSKNVKTDILVEQNRAIGLLDAFDKSILGYNLNNLMENYYQFKYLKELLHTRAKKLYSFRLKSYAQNKDYNYIIVKPLSNVRGELSEYYILYDTKKDLIIEVGSLLPEDRVSKDKDILDFKKRSIFKSEFRTTYRFKNNQYYLANSKEKIGFESNNNKKKVRFEIKSYFVITEFRSKNFKYKDNEVFKDKSLINAKNSVITEFWELDSGIILTKAENDIIDSLVK